MLSKLSRAMLSFALIVGVAGSVAVEASAEDSSKTAPPEQSADTSSKPTAPEQSADASSKPTAPQQSADASSKPTAPQQSADTSSAAAHITLAKQKLRLLNFQGALREYDQAIIADPHNVQAYGGRALIHAYMGNYAAAVNDVEQGLASRDPPDPNLMFCGGYAYLALGDGNRAATEFLSYLNRTRWRTDEVLYAVIGQTLGTRQDGNDAQAAKILDDAAARISGTGWPVPILMYLSRKLTAEELLALARDKSQLTEAHCYIGVDLAQAGKPTAKEHLRWVVANGDKTYLEYFLSRAWLKRHAAATK